MRTQLAIEIAVRSPGLGHEARDYLEQRMREALKLAPSPVLHARASIDVIANPAADRPVEVDASVDVNGTVVTAHTHGESAPEAIDELKDVLQHEFEHLAQHRQARRRRPFTARPGQWRHGDVPTERPDHLPRPAEEREIVARSTWTPGVATVEEAVEDLTRLGHDFQLFTEAVTGADGLLIRGQDGQFELRLAADATLAPSLPVELRAGAPILPVADAIEALETADLPFLFFIETESGRGAVLYHRDDGHYGLVTAATG